MKRPWIIIPAHNRRELTLGCLATLQANGDFDHADVVLVDDGSTDGTRAAVRAQFPGVMVLEGDGSLYWTGAIAFAMQHQATRHLDGPIFWLNDDCRPRPAALGSITRLLLAQPTAVVGPRCVDTATGQPIATGFTGRRTFAPEVGATLRVQGLSGFCVGVGATAWRQLGVPDTARFPHYGGDTAYSLQASRQGLPVWLTGDAEVELADHQAERSQLGAHVRPEESAVRNTRRILLATHSPFRLPTLFALQRLKYGRVAGTVLGAARAAAWAVQLSWHLLRRHG